MSCDSQVAEVALSLSDFNPAAKMAPNPALLSEMRQGAPEEVRVLIRSYMFVCLYLCVCAKQSIWMRKVVALVWRKHCGNVICRLIQLSETLTRVPALINKR